MKNPKINKTKNSNQFLIKIIDNTENGDYCLFGHLEITPELRDKILKLKGYAESIDKDNMSFYSIEVFDSSLAIYVTGQNLRL